MSTMVRRFASADSSPLRERPTTATRVFDSTLKGFYGSPGKATAKSTGDKMHMDNVGDVDSPGAQWSSPSLAKNNVLKRMQSEEKILRRLTGTLDLSSKITRTPSVAARDAKTLMSDPAVKAVRERSRSAVKSNKTQQTSHRGRSTERRVDTFNASDRSASPARQRTLQGAQGVRMLVGDGVEAGSEGERKGEDGGQTEDNHFESEREASYLNKHLGISTAEELWHDELIGEYWRADLVIVEHSWDASCHRGDSYP